MPMERLLASFASGGSAETWAEFVRRFHPVISLTVLRTSRQYGEVSSVIVEDLVQDVYLKFCQDARSSLGGFELRHPDAIFGYVKISAANVVRDHYKSELASRRNRSLLVPLDMVDEPAVEGQAARNVTLREIDDVLGRRLEGATAVRDRTVFWLHYRTGLTARAIAELPSVALSVKGVESLLLRLTHMVREEFAPGGRDPLSKFVSGSR